MFVEFLMDLDISTWYTVISRFLENPYSNSVIILDIFYDLFEINMFLIFSDNLLIDFNLLYIFY